MIGIDIIGIDRGRASVRGLVRAGSIGLCLIGLACMAGGAAIPAKAVAAQMLLERAFDRSLVSHRAERPWPWADMAPVARLSVARLGVDRIVLDTGSGQAMAFGPTLLPGGARIGRHGTAVIAAHRDTHFRFLRNVGRGDAIVIEDATGGIHRYRVTGMAIVRWDAFAIDRQDDRQRIVLTTCYPFGAVAHGPLRYVVYAELLGARHVS